MWLKIWTYIYITMYVVLEKYFFEVIAFSSLKTCFLGAGIIYYKWQYGQQLPLSKKSFIIHENGWASCNILRGRDRTNHNILHVISVFWCIEKNLFYGKCYAVFLISSKFHIFNLTTFACVCVFVCVYIRLCVYILHMCSISS